MVHKTLWRETDRTRLYLKDALYIAFNIGCVASNCSSRQLMVRKLSPVSLWPNCDMCGEGPDGVSDRYGTRWAYHEQCYREALRESPTTVSQPPFTRWLTYLQWCAIDRAMKRGGMDVMALISTKDGWRMDSMADQWDEARVLFEVEYARFMNGGQHEGDRVLSRAV